MQESFTYSTLYNILRIYFYCFQLHIFYCENAKKGGNSALLLFQNQCSLKQCQKNPIVVSGLKKNILTNRKGIQDWDLGKADQWEKA